MSGTGDSIESVVGSWPIAANRHRNLLTPPLWFDANASPLDRTFARLQVSQFLGIPLCPGEEIDKICRILSR